NVISKSIAGAQRRVCSTTSSLSPNAPSEKKRSRVASVAADRTAPTTNAALPHLWAMAGSNKATAKWARIATSIYFTAVSGPSFAVGLNQGESSRRTHDHITRTSVSHPEDTSYRTPFVDRRTERSTYHVMIFSIRSGRLRSTLV